MSVLKRVLQNEFVQGSFFLTGSTFLVNILNYFFNLITARKLGPALFGDFTTLFSYLAIVSVPVTILTTVVIKKIAERGNERFEYAAMLEKWFLKRVRKFGFLILLVIPMWFLLPKFANLTREASVAFSLLLGLSIIIGFYDAVIQGTREIQVFSYLGIISVVTKLTGALLLYTVIGSYSLLLFLILVGLLIRIPIIRMAINKKNSGKKITLSQTRLLHAVMNKNVLYSAASLLGITVLGNADIIIVKKLFSAEQSGIYASWLLLSKIILYAAGSVLPLSFIFFASADQKKNHKKMLLISLTVLALFSLVCIVGYSTFGTVLVHILFGTRFEMVIPYMQLAGIFGALYLLVLFINQYFISQHSNAALIAPALAPLYLFLLFTQSTSLHAVMMINSIFAAFMLILYLLEISRSYFNANSKRKE